MPDDGSHELSLNLIKTTEICFMFTGKKYYTLIKVKAKTNLAIASLLANGQMQSSSYSAFIKKISKELSISKLARGTHRGADNIFHELSAPDDQNNLQEFALKPFQMLSLSRFLRQLRETRTTQISYQPQDSSTRWF